MSKPKRYFENNNEEWNNRDFSIVPEEWLPKITELVDEIIRKQPPSHRDVAGGLYSGGAGVAYMLYHLINRPGFTASESKFYDTAFKYIQHALEYAEFREKNIKEKSAFLLGHCGTYALAAALYRTKDEGKAEKYLQKFTAAAANVKPLDFLRCGGDELFVGRAGYLFAARWLEKQFGKTIVPEKDINEICKTILDSGLLYAIGHHRKSGLMYSYYDTEYLGAAHGLSSILQSLLICPSYLQASPHIEIYIKKAVDWLLSLQMENGNFPCSTDEIGIRNRDNELVHWCHGAPGVAHLMAKAYLLWKDPKYLQALEKCGDLIWQKGLLRKGPGICHGVAGNAYVFLLLYRIKNNDPHWLWRALQFMRFIFSEEFKKGTSTPDCPYSLFEGWAGTVCFMVDMLNLDKASFPFFEIFD